MYVPKLPCLAPANRNMREARDLSPSKSCHLMDLVPILTSPSRIEDALLRYQKNRRLESDRRDVFLKYLAYGGVNVGQRMFGGLDGRDLQQMDSEQILQARSMTSVGKDRSNLTVDFDAVVRGFLYELYTP